MGVRQGMPLCPTSAASAPNRTCSLGCCRFAELYQEDGLTGGHVIMLGADEASKVSGSGATWTGLASTDGRA